MNERRLLRDERGAIMLIALIFAIFALAMLYAAIGTAQGVLLRERLQDAADSSVLSGAVMSARAMNLLVLINIVMAALLSVLVTLKLLEAIAIVGIIIAAGLAYPTWGASLSAIPPLNMVRGKMHDAHEQLKDPIEQALDTLHDAAGMIAGAVPGAAEGVVDAEIANQGAPITGGVVAVAKTLPVEDDEFKVLCGQAGRFPFDLAQSALEPIGIGVIMGALSDPMETMATSFSDWFCGDGGTNPPAYDRKEKLWFPRLESADACEASKDDTGGDWTNYSAKGAESFECTKSKLEEEQATPDYDKDTKNGTGNCRTQCGIDGPYETKASMARTECAPTSSPTPIQYQYQTRKGHVEYTWMKKLWKRGEPKYDRPAFADGTRPPCGPDSVFPSIATGYNATVRKSKDVAELLPVCSNEQPPPAPVIDPRAPDEVIVRKVEFTEVTHIFACRKEVTVKAEVNGEQAEDSSDRAPKHILETVKLGDEPFQLRVIVQGETPSSTTADRVVRLSLWSHPEEESTVSELRGFGGFAVAQAEFFYDGTDGREAWMWNMNWRARLRRFKATDEQLEPLRKHCGDFANALSDGAVGSNQCAPLLDRVSALGKLIGH